MKKIIFLILILFSFLISCNNKSEEENILYNVLIESTNKITKSNENLLKIYKYKFAELSIKNEDLCILTEKYNKINFFFQSTSLNNSNLNKLILELNKHKKYQFSISEIVINNLEKNIAHFYIKYHLQKQIENMLNNLETNVVSGCGYTIFNNIEKQELMEKLRTMEVEEFKKEICNQ